MSEQDEIERLRMQLAACGVVALSNTRESAAINREMHPDYWTASCGDVAKAVDREMEHREALERLTAQLSDGTASDGYHTFNELYEYRMLYNAALFNEWGKTGAYGVHKSKRHHDGKQPFGGGWFVVTCLLPTGQISNHYKLEHWPMFQVPVFETAAKWDGHTPAEAAYRLSEFIRRTQ